jgi:heme/copper-type cytochrome/quinol oxidase subunit 2
MSEHEALEDTAMPTEATDPGIWLLLLLGAVIWLIVIVVVARIAVRAMRSRSDRDEAGVSGESMEQLAPTEGGTEHAEEERRRMAALRERDPGPPND